jgi:hypothetical protein
MKRSHINREILDSVQECHRQSAGIGRDAIRKNVNLPRVEAWVIVGRAFSLLPEQFQTSGNKGRLVSAVEKSLVSCEDSSARFRAWSHWTGRPVTTMIAESVSTAFWQTLRQIRRPNMD